MSNRTMINAYGYVRDKFGDFSSGINLVKKTSREVGIEIKTIYTSKSDGKYENMDLAKSVTDSLKNLKKLAEIMDLLEEEKDGKIVF